MNKETIKEVVRQFNDRKLSDTKSRSVSVPTDSGKVVCLTGARRTGKTFIFFQIMKELMARGIKREQILYPVNST